MKLEQIKSSVNLPFNSFPSCGELLQPAVKEPAKPLDIVRNGQPVSYSSDVEDFLLGAGSNVDESVDGSMESVNVPVENKEDNAVGSALEMEEKEDTMSLSDLSSSFQKCLPSTNRTRNGKLTEKSQERVGFLQLEPFDYEAAKKQVIFGEDPGGKLGTRVEDSKRRLNKEDKKSLKEDGVRDLPQGRRRQAFPASGNRSATFR